MLSRIYHAFPVFTMLYRNFPCLLGIFETFGEIKARDLPGLPGQHFLGWDFPCFPGIPGISSVSWDILILCFPRISYSLPGFRMLSQDFPRLPGISHALQGFFRFLLDFVFWRQYFFFCFIAQGKLRGEKNIMHSLGLNFSKSFGQPPF